jgi:hypothetical protein
MSAATLVAVAVLTYLLTKRKERETDWRKVKLDLYREYVLALPGVVKQNKTSEDQVKYGDAANSLTLVASPAVLKTLYAFRARLNQLLNALRQDLYPSARRDRGDLAFRFFSSPLSQTNNHIDPPVGQ